MATNKVDPYLNSPFSLYKSNYSKDNGAHGNTLVPVFIKSSNPSEVVADVRESGGKARILHGDVISAEIAVQSISVLLALPGIEYIEASKPLSLNLDKSLTAIGAEAVRNGDVDAVPYCGEGVIIGIIDTGIDWSHEVFYDDEGNSRIISIWDQTIDSEDGFAAPAQIDDTYGIECLRSHIRKGTCPSVDDVGHGTHVAGIAAGNGNIYGGVAPCAELIMVKVHGKYDEDGNEIAVFSNRVLDAADYIFEKAASEGKPAVINMSMGHHYGAHDGTSLFEQGLNSYLSGTSGRAFINGAGNNRNQNDGVVASIHAGATMNDEECRYEFLSFSSDANYIYLDIWQGEGANLSFGLGVDDYDSYEESGLVIAGDVLETTADNGLLNIIIDSSEVSNPMNGRKHTVLQIGVAADNAMDVSMENYAFDLIVSGSGYFDAWIVDGGGSFTKRSGGYLNAGNNYCVGDSRRTVIIPATAENVVSVASYASRSDLATNYVFELPSVWNGYEFTLDGELSPFSSAGPSSSWQATGQKPEITAPGEWVVSAMSKDALSDYSEIYGIMTTDMKYIALRGTSMAAPHVSGAVALLFERNPTLNADAVEKLLARNAQVDGAMGSVPNNLWGYGKLDILKAMQNIDTTDLVTPLPVSDEDVPEIEYAPSVATSTTNGGCVLLTVAAPHETSNIMLLAMFLLLFLVIRSRRSKRVFMVILVTALMVSCGGSKDSVDIPWADLYGPDDDTPNTVQREYLSIDADYMRAIYWSLSEDNKTWTKIVMPLNSFFAGETIEVGALGAPYIMTSTYASSLISEDDEYLYSVEDEGPVSSMISTSGTISYERTGVKEGNTFRCQLSDVRMRSIDMESNMIEREGDTYIYSKSVDYKVNEGIEGAIIVDVSPDSGPIGTEVILKGFNYGPIASETDVTFSGCWGKNLPSERIADHEIRVKVNSICDDTHFRVTAEYMSSQKSIQLFQLDLPIILKSEMPDRRDDVSKVVYDEDSGNIYMLFEDSDNLYVYSMNDAEFVEVINLPHTADTFDIDVAAGTTVIAKDKDVYVLDDNYAEVQHVVITEGDYVGDIAIGPGGKSLLLGVYAGSAPSVGVLTLNNGNLEYPVELTPKSSHSYETELVVQADRTLVALHSVNDSYNVAMYRMDTVGTVTKEIDAKVATYFQYAKLIQDELWTVHKVYNLNLEYVHDVASSSVESVHPICGGSHFVQQNAKYISIYDVATGEAEALSIPLSTSDIYKGEYNNIYISKEGDWAAFVRDEGVYQIQLSELYSCP